MKMNDLTVPANPVLALSYRSGLVEIEHRGAICAIDGEGNVCFQRGNIEGVIYPRSALKFVQVLPLLESGAASHYDFTLEEIAVMCASHNAEPAHLEVVKAIFAKTGISITALGCGTHPSLSDQRAKAQILEKRSLSDLDNNCSGKHAGFLALTKFLALPLEGYLHPDHPIQQLVRKTVCEVFQIEESRLHFGVDGCSAPNYALPIRNLALGMARMVNGISAREEQQIAFQTVINAITQFPYMVGGTNRFCTELMQVTQGKVIGKLGAAGVYVLGIPAKGIGCAIKIEDGAHGPQYQVVMEFLRQMEVLSPEEFAQLAHWHRSPVLNCKGAEVGFIRAVEEVFTQK